MQLGKCLHACQVYEIAGLHSAQHQDDGARRGRCLDAQYALGGEHDVRGLLEVGRRDGPVELVLAHAARGV